MELTSEQQAFISSALSGANVLVDACIGSGKTTAIERLCDAYPSEKKILYLTYNRLLKFDARKKIKNQNVLVTNYHGFAAHSLQERSRNVAVDDLINVFLKERPDIPHYDVLIIDEYQDIERDFSLMLLYIKEHCPSIQLIAVGDLDQKLYDFSSLDVEEFMKGFLGEHLSLSFSTCFRLSSEYASRLGKMWRKTIKGANEDCRIRTMEPGEVVDFLKGKETRDILCLGNRKGLLSETLNALERECPGKFSKKTVYSSIRDSDSFHIEPRKDSAIFTTFDSSKGLERDVVVVFDFVKGNWANRAKRGSADLRILKNIFLVAISRGKKEIVFVKRPEEEFLEEDFLVEADRGNDYVNLEESRFQISRMFDFKYAEDVDDCYSELLIKEILPPSRPIEAKTSDGLIDLSPCLGIYQEASYFDHYDFDKAIARQKEISPRNPLLKRRPIRREGESDSSYIQRMILFLTALETDQVRYMEQVEVPFLGKDVDIQIRNRLMPIVSSSDATQVPCHIPYRSKDLHFEMVGYADVVKEGMVYELKFVSSLSKSHFLQCACYMVALGLDKGIVYNGKNDSCYQISMNNPERFLSKVTRCITKRRISKYERISTKIAILDVETNYADEAMSIGIVLSDEDFLPLESRYFLIRPAYQEPSLYGDRLFSYDGPYKVGTRIEVMEEIREWLSHNHVTALFAYNALFDKQHLPELDGYPWFDIMRIASYKNHNKFILEGMEVSQGGRLVRGYGVEDIIRMIDKDDPSYEESHNALLDAKDELWIMKKLDRTISYYAKYAQVGERKKGKESQKEKENLYSLETAAKLLGVKSNHLRFCVNLKQAPSSGLDSEKNPLFSSEDLAKAKEIFPPEKRKEVPHVTGGESAKQEYLTVYKAAKMLGIERKELYEHIKLGHIHVSKRTKGGWPLFTLEDIEKAKAKIDEGNEETIGFKVVIAIIALFLAIILIAVGCSPR